ncbi:hypothetical protein [Streptomyces sp. NPDC020965]|uniref:hypothetical protein n=1 Tax=Streptomyces sp. NPDC020965 TaxID=3365105 RepID=UPI0037B2994A
MNLRMIGIASVVVVAALLPLAAAAGPADVFLRPAGTHSARDPIDPSDWRVNPSDSAEHPDSAEHADVVERPGPVEYSEPEGYGPSRPDPARPSGRTSRALQTAETDPAATASGYRNTTRALCGPEVASAVGVEAQTCVLNKGQHTWARTYYRNTTGAELSSVLTLMGPDARTVQINCSVEAGGEPGVCETPKETSRGVVMDGAREYSAVAEFAAAGGADQNPLLLRVGSNSPEGGQR